STFRDLVATIDTSAAIVYLMEGWCGGETPSCVQMPRDAAGQVLIVRVDPRRSIVDVVRQLAHELQHVREIIGRPDIVDRTSLNGLYAGIGFRSCKSTNEDCWETPDALAVEAKVLREIHTKSSTLDSAYFGVWTLNAAKSSWGAAAVPIESTRIHSDRG